MGLTGSSSCNVPSCSRTWERHPVLEVKCPSCQQEIGSPCQRPSGHPVNGEHGKYHTQRYYEALDEGHFGECPLDRCPESSEQSKARKEKPIEREKDQTKQTELPV